MIIIIIDICLKSLSNLIFEIDNESFANIGVMMSGRGRQAARKNNMFYRAGDLCLFYRCNDRVLFYLIRK